MGRRTMQPGTPGPLRKAMGSKTVTLPLPVAALVAILVLLGCGLLPVVAAKTVGAMRTGAGEPAFDEERSRAMARWIAADAVNIVREHEQTDPMINCLMEAGDYDRSSRAVISRLKAMEPDSYAEFSYPIYLPDLEGLALADLYFGASAEEKRSWLRRQILAMPKENFKEYQMICILEEGEVSWYTIELDDMVDTLRVELEVYFATNSYGARPQAVLLRDGREFVF